MDEILGVSAHLDISELRSSAEEMIETLRNLADEQAKLNAELGNFGDGDNINELRQKLIDYIDVTKETAEAAEDAYSQQQEYVEKLTEELQNLNEKKREANENPEQLDELNKQYEEYSEELTKAEKNLGILQDAVNQAKQEVDNSTEALNRCNQAIIGMAWDKAIEGVKGWATGHGQFKSGLEELKKSIDLLPLPIKSVTQGIGGMTKAMRIMMSTPLGAVIGAIVLALQALFSWFKKSAEGQKAFASVSAYISSILASLSDIAIKVGKYLFHAFADSSGPMNEFAKGMVVTFKSAVKAVVGMFKGLGHTLKGVFTADWDLFKQGIDEIGKGTGAVLNTAVNAIKTQIAGIKGVIKMAQDGFDAMSNTDVLDSLKTMHSKAKESAKLALDQKETEIAISKAKEKEAALDIEIAESREKIYKLTGKERLEEIQKLKTMQQQKFGERIKQYEELHRIQKRTNELHASTLADEEKERQLNIQLLQLKAQQAAATRMTARLEESTKRTLENAEKKSQTKNTKQSAAIDKAQAKLAETLYATEEAQIKQEHDMEQKIANARVDAMKEGFNKTMAERKRENEAELDAIEQQRQAAIEAERKRQKSVFQAEQTVIKAQGGKPKEWDNSMFDPNSKEATLINAQYDKLVTLTKQKQNNQAEEQRKEERQYLYDYLKEYGDFQQQKLAITEEYAEKIREAEESGNVWLAESLRQQEAGAVSAAKMQDIKNSMDWEGLFNNLNRYSVDFLQSVRDKLQALLNDPNLDPSDKKVIAEKINDVDDMLDQKQGSTFNWINEYLTEQRRLQEEAKAAADAYTAALTEQNAALGMLTLKQEEVTNMVEEMGGSDMLKKLIPDPSKLKSTDFGTIAKGLGIKEGSKEYKKLEEAFKKLAGAESRVTTATAKATKAQGEKQNAEEKANVALKDRVAGFLGGLNEDVQKYLGDLPGLMDQLGIGGSERVQAGLNAFNSASGAAADFATGNYIGAASKGLSALTSLGDALFGGSKESDETYVEDMQRLTRSNEILTEAIDRLSDTMENSDFLGIEESYDRQVRYLQTIEKNLQEQTTRSLKSSKSSNWLGGGGENSSAYEMAKHLTLEERKQMSELTGVDFYHLKTSLFDRGSEDFAEKLGTLTPEQMAALREEPELWARILELADAGHQNASEYLEQMADLGKQYEEAEQQRLENINKISFDSLKSSFADALMSMEDDATDTAEYISKIMANALIQDLVNSEEYQGKLKKWNEKLAKALQITDEKEQEKELAELRKEYQDLQDEAAEEAEKIKQATGYTDAYNAKKQEQQSASFNSAQNITYEQADAIYGAVLSQSIVQEQSLAKTTIISDCMVKIQPDISLIKDSIITIVETHAMMNDHLAQISANTAVLPAMQSDIAKLRKAVEEQ